MQPLGLAGGVYSPVGRGIQVYAPSQFGHTQCSHDLPRAQRKFVCMDDAHSSESGSVGTRCVCRGHVHRRSSVSVQTSVRKMGWTMRSPCVRALRHKCHPVYNDVACPRLHSATPCLFSHANPCWTWSSSHSTSRNCTWNYPCHQLRVRRGFSRVVSENVSVSVCLFECA